MGVFLCVLAGIFAGTGVFAAQVSWMAMRQTKLALEEIRARRHPIAPRDVNVVAGVVLPLPTDPRWRLAMIPGPKRKDGTRERHRGARLGPVVVRGVGDAQPWVVEVRGRAVGFGGEEAKEYARAVEREVLGREVMRQIEEAP